VFSEDFAAKLPQSPQLTVLEYHGIQKPERTTKLPQKIQIKKPPESSFFNLSAKKITSYRPQESCLLRL
jgi:hypothetical protein